MTSVDQIRENCERLLAYSRSLDESERDFFHSLIGRGTCFFPLYVGEELAFFPSRFIGYQDNSRDKHLSTDAKNGRETNEVISLLLNNTKPEQDATLEGEYREFCDRYKIRFGETGNFGVARKYWPIHGQPEPVSDQVGDILNIANDTGISATQKLRLLAARVGQGDFRKALIAEWGSCAVTGCRSIEILRASHIKPWKLSTNKERLDPDNGLLLVPNLDTSFDRYLITFSDEGKIIISNRLSATDREALGLKADMTVPISAGRERYLSHHRARFYEEEAGS